MAFARRIQNPEGLYFITFATVQWVDVFTRSIYIDTVLESLKYCQKEKGLRIHAWCIMSNPVGVGCYGCLKRLGRIMPKTRTTNGATIRFWQQEKHPIELISNKFIDQKLAYIHENPAGGVPLKAGLADEPREYRFSSARDYMNNQKGLLEVELI